MSTILLFQALLHLCLLWLCVFILMHPRLLKDRSQYLVEN